MRTAPGKNSNLMVLAAPKSICFTHSPGRIQNHSPAAPTDNCDNFKYAVVLVIGMQTFTAIVQKEEDMYVAKCPETGTVSQGLTIEEAVANLKEATELYLEEFPMKEMGHPILTTFDVANGAKA